MYLMNWEVLLSIAVLGLVFYSAYNPIGIFKWSVGTLLIIGAITIGGGIPDVWGVLIGTNGLLMVSGWILILKVIVIVGSISILLMSGNVEPGLIMMVGLSSLLLVSSVNWLSVYLAIELQTLSLFILAALKRDSTYSTEAGLKYFVLGAVSSGLFLFGCALLYGFAGETSIQGINSVLRGDVGKILITVSLLFKLSAAPFHM
jgi:NADH-quinone oxidoreductase subunit N